MRYVVVDAERESVDGLVRVEVLVNGDDVGGGGILAAETVSAAYDLRFNVLVGSGSPMAPGSFVLSMTAIFFTVAGRAAARCFAENGL